MCTHVLQSLIPNNLELIDDVVNKCGTYSCAKQTRKSFLVSNIKSTDKFDLVHIDVQGPYKIPAIDGSK